VILDFNRLAAGGLRKQPAGGEENRRLSIFSARTTACPCAGSGLRKVYESTVNCALLFPFAVTLRRSHDVRINQRIDSLPCPALFSMFPGRLACFARERSCERLRVPLARIYQTATIGPAGLYCWLDYGGGRGGGWGVGVGSD